MPGGSNFTLCLLFCCFAKLLLVQNQIVPQNYTRKQSVKHADKNTSISSIGHNKLTDKGTSISSTGSASYDDKNTSISSIGQNKLTDKGTFVSSTGSASNDDKSTPVSSTGSASNDDKSTPVSSTGSASNDDKSTSVSSTGSDKSEVNSTPETNIYPTTTGVRSTSVIQTFTTTIASEETTPVTTVHGRSCSNTSSCDDNMECWNSKCVCQLNHYWSGNNQTCLQIVFDSQINITNVANTSLYLRWTEPDLDAPVNGSIQYSVKLEAGGKVTSKNVSTETSYNVQNLVPGENYTFSVVLIISDDGRSKNISSSLKNVTTVPDPPDSMNISSNFGPDITLTFSVTDGYISYCTVTVVGDDGFNFAKNTSENCTSLEVSGLENGTFYKVNVTAISGDKISMWKMFSFNTTASASEKVQSLIASSINFTTITVNWTRPNVTNGNITCYVILLNSTSDGKCLQAFVLSNDNNCANVCSNDCSQCTNPVGNTNGHTSNDTETISLSQLQPESSYTVTVIPYNSYGPGMSDTTHVNLPAGPSEKVQSLIASSINFTAITVNWTRPKVTNGNITCYVILLNDTSDGKCLQAFVLSKDNNCANVCSNDCSQCTNPVGNTNGHTSNDTETISISQLQPESSYTVTVIPYNSYGPGMSDTIHVNLPAGPSEKVSSFSVADVSNTTVTVIWTKPNVTNGDLTGYVLVIAQVGNDSRKTICFGNISMATAPYDNLESINDSMRYTANDIPPDTEIELTLYPINSAGNGSATTIRNRTLEAVPSILQNVTFQFLQNNTIEFKWVPPMPRPGVTNYSLTVRHSQKPYEKHDYEVEHRVNMSGWNTNRTVANYSYNGWEYQFQLDVFTAVGRPPPFVLNISTPEAAPGQVQNLHVVPNENDFNSINVTWECPTPEERNGRIQNFTFSNDQLTNSLGVRNTSRTLKLENINCELKTFRENIPVYPGNTYIFQVFANNANFTGKITKYTYNTSIGRPPLLTFEIALSDISPTTSSLSVKYCPACLVNTINGEIIYTAVVVCANDYSVSENLSSLTFINTMNTWHNASEENFKTIYRPTNESWVHQVQMNSKQNGSVAVFVVGSDENCWSTPGEYCNGPLPSGRAFKVAFVTCTRTACSPSNFSEVLWTAEEDTADMGAIVGGVLGGICAVAAVLGFVWYRRRQARKEHNLRYDPVDTETLSFNVRPVPMHDFKDKVQEWMSQEKNERGMPVLLAEQFKEIKELSEKKHSQDAALQDENKGKNRYTNILPYDHSRVKLSIHGNEESSDFINANYIPGYHSKREYIATQGPLESTVNDFWQMVWEQQVPAILMLSGFMEGRTNKVHPYYPTDNTLFQSISYGAVTVMLKEVVETTGYTRRTFEIETNRQSRRVYHFYIKGWKDYDANLPVNPVLAFVQAVRDVVPVNSRHPLLVHCSAGVGRTGTIIGIDYFMHYVREKSLSEPIDIFRYVLLMREYRPSMVQSCEQYVFLHKAVAELVRRKKDPDHYDEPVYTNTAYEEDEHMYANC